MKMYFNRRYNTIAVYVVLVVAICTVIVAAVANYHKILGLAGTVVSLLRPFIIGFVIAYVLNPILNGIEKHVMKRLFKGKIPPRVNRAVSLVLTYVVTVFILSVFSSVVIPQIASSIANLAGQVPGWIVSAQQLGVTLIEKYDLKNFQTLQPETWNQIMDEVRKIVGMASSMVKNAIPQVLQATLSVTTSLLNVVLGIIISIYILLGKERFFAQIKKLLAALLPVNVVDKILDITHQSNHIFSGFISGKILDSAIIGVICFCGMSILKIPYAMLISVIVGVTNIIPYFGPFIGAIPSLLILLIIDPVKAIWFAIFVLCLQQLDGNVIGPKILGDSTGLSAFWVIFSITVFGNLLGVVGMFVGVPLFAVIYSLIRQFSVWRLQAKGLATETVAYASDDHTLIDKARKEKGTHKLAGLFKKK